MSIYNHPESWLVREVFMGVHQVTYGPFPSQDQALTYREYLLNLLGTHPYRDSMEYLVERLIPAAFMPERIHA